MAVACIICWHYASCVPITYARSYAGIVGSDLSQYVTVNYHVFYSRPLLTQEHTNATSFFGMTMNKTTTTTIFHNPLSDYLCTLLPCLLIPVLYIRQGPM